MSEKSLAVSLTLVISLIFLTGYTYLDGYYDFYDISVGELELDIQNILVFSAPVYWSIFVDYSIIVVFVIISVLGFLLAIKYYWQRFATKIPVILGVIVAGIFFVCLFLSHSLGLQSAALDISSLNRMSVGGVPLPKEFSEILARHPSARLHHLVTTTSTVYGVIRFMGGEDRWVIRLPTSPNLTTQVYQEGGSLT